MCGLYLYLYTRFSRLIASILDILLSDSFLGVVVFGNVSDAFSTWGSAFVSNLYMLLGIYEPQDDMDVAAQPGVANLYYWSYTVIGFFILLNAFLAIVVEAYANVKGDADSKAELDPLNNRVQSLLRRVHKPALFEIEIPDKYLVQVLDDLYDNINTQKNANLPGMAIKVMVPHVDDDGITELHKAGERATLIGENIDGTLHVRYATGDKKSLDADVAVEDVEAAQLKQVRLPTDIVERIMLASIETMTTKTRFYLVSREDKPALLDQVALLLSLKTLAPTMHIKICMALSMNILTRFGHNADLNGDGVISPKEWDALEAVMRYQEDQNLIRPLDQRNKNNFVQMMLF